MKKQRPVQIVYLEERKSWMVKYLDRKKGGRYCAAMFLAEITSKEEVKEWITKNRLTLIEKTND